jgi:hypothetical protein
MENFEPERYVGLWYEVGRIPQFYENGAKCSTAFYSLDRLTGRIDVYNTGYGGPQHIEPIRGYADQLAPGQLRVSFPSSPYPQGIETVPTLPTMLTGPLLGPLTNELSTFWEDILVSLRNNWTPSRYMVLLWGMI